MTPETTIPAEVQTLAAAAPHFLETVKVVATAEEMTVAMGELADIKQMEKDLLAKKKELIEPFNEGIKRINAFFQVPLDKLSQAKQGHDRAIVSYRQVEQARVAEENRRRQEEVNRQQAFLRAQAAARAAKAAKEEAERRRKADEAEAAGRAAQAAKLRSQADSIAERAETQAAVTESTVATMVAPTVEPDIPKSDAGHFARRYSAKVESLPNLVCAIADAIRAGVAFPPVNLVKPDQTAINSLAKSLKEHFTVAGCALETETSVVSKKR